MHLRPEIPGVDRPDRQRRILDREHGAELVERRLPGAVAAPSLVGLDPGIGGDVDQARSRRGQQEGERGLGHAEWRHHVHLEGDAQDVERVVGQRREGGRAEGAGVVDQEVEAPQGAGRGDQCPAVLLVGDVAGKGAEDRARRQQRFEPGLGDGERCGLPAVYDQ